MAKKWLTDKKTTTMLVEKSDKLNMRKLANEGESDAKLFKRILDEYILLKNIEIGSLKPKHAYSLRNDVYSPSQVSVSSSSQEPDLQD